MLYEQLKKFSNLKPIIQGGYICGTSCEIFYVWIEVNGDIYDLTLKITRFYLNEEDREHFDSVKFYYKLYEHQQLSCDDLPIYQHLVRVKETGSVCDYFEEAPPALKTIRNKVNVRIAKIFNKK